MCLVFIDALRADFHAKAKREVYVELSAEDHEESVCGLLKRAMYGTRDAAKSWEAEDTEMLQEAVFSQGNYSARVFYHEQKKIRIVVYGDDFTVPGGSKELDWLREAIQKRMEVKFKGRLEKSRSSENIEQKGNCDGARVGV